MVTLCSAHLKLHHLNDYMTGHLWWWQREGSGTIEKMLLEGYGTVARWNGALGVCFILRSWAVGFCYTNAII